VSSFTHRLAERGDIALLQSLMRASIGQLLAPYLAPEAVAASFSIMGLDTQLIDDGAYYVVEARSQIVGCGGWSRRATLFGGDHSTGRDRALLDPAKDAARVRAMYTHPLWTRQGIARLVLSLCEAGAARAGFTRVELAATLAGEPLYRACGYRLVERFRAGTPEGIAIPLSRMEKALPAQA
jgi:GNAT superfamily N-acetyltransferase